MFQITERIKFRAIRSDSRSRRYASTCENFVTNYAVMMWINWNFQESSMLRRKLIKKVPRLSEGGAEKSALSQLADRISFV